MRSFVILLALVGCGDEAARRALEARVEQMQQRLDALEVEAARREAAVAATKPEALAIAESAPAGRPPEPVLRISLDRGGARVEGVPVRAEDFDAKLAEIGRAGGVRSVLVQVEQDLPQSEVTALLDRIKQSGLGGGNVALVRGEAGMLADDESGDELGG